MKHDWDRIGGVQWEVLGLPSDAARSDYKCAQCGGTFSHWYHIESNIYVAMSKVPKECYPMLKEENK